MFSALWSLSVTIGTVLLVSLFTKQKTDAELQNLVLGMTPPPVEEPCPWYQKPLFWAAVIMAVLIAVNIIFW
jgi:SSS family solute:Na+ symporter